MPLPKFDPTGLGAGREDRRSFVTMLALKFAMGLSPVYLDGRIRCFDARSIIAVTTRALGFALQYVTM